MLWVYGHYKYFYVRIEKTTHNVRLEFGNDMTFIIKYKNI